MQKIQKKKFRINHLLVVFFLLAFNFSSSQIVTDYKVFCNNNVLKKMKYYNFKDKQDKFVTQQILYLGDIISEKNKSYKVLTSHTNLAGKGVNDLIFVSTKGTPSTYRMNLISDMPFKISNNKLFFREEKTKKVKAIKITELKPIFCSPFECF